jgi:hypothetical protein
MAPLAGYMAPLRSGHELHVDHRRTPLERLLDGAGLWLAVGGGG